MPESLVTGRWLDDALGASIEGVTIDQLLSAGDYTAEKVSALYELPEKYTSKIAQPEGDREAFAQRTCREGPETCRAVQ